MLKCPNCTKTYKTEKGLAKHFTAKHAAGAQAKAEAAPKRKAPPGYQ